MTRQRCTIFFTGRVQGVGFRMNAAAVVRVYPALTGWVRNESDGSVQLVIEGERPQIEACLSNLRQRMQRNIEKEYINWADATNDFTTFTTRY